MPVRIRLAVLFAVATAATITVGGVVFVRSLESGLRSSLDTGLRSRADALVQTVHDAPANLNFQDSGNQGLLRPRDAIAQVVDARGRVVEASEDAGEHPLVSTATRNRAQTRPTFATASIDGEPYRALATAVRTTDGTYTVVVASSAESAENAITRVKTGLVVGGSVAVVLAALGAWLLASAALGPVERMRRTAADISEHDATSRLPVPSTRDEIAALATTMNELLARLQGALVRERAFVADAGHELRTPLAVLRAELELADRPQRSRDDLLDAIRNAALETDRLARLAEELLFLARSDADPADRQLDVGPVVPILERSVEAFLGRASARDVALQVTGDRGLSAPLDPDRLRRAVDNLVDNALRFAPAESAVVLHARHENGEAVVEVRDRGPGFPVAFLPHAFERFRRADDARSRQDGGSGLGLAIVQAVAKRHGGTAVARNLPTGGAAVSIRVPMSRHDDRSARDADAEM